MINKLQPQTLLEIIKQQNIINNPLIVPPASSSFLPKRSDYPYELVIQGDMDIEGKNVAIFLVFDSFFPSSIILAFLKDPNALGFLPHIEKDGYICFIEKEGMLINYSSLDALLHETLAKIQITLSNGFKSVAEHSYDDFYNEFESYWRNAESAVQIYSLFEFGNTARIVTESLFQKDPPVTNIKNIAFDSYEKFRAFIIKEYGKDFFGTLSMHNALYIPLTKPVMPPSYGKFWTIKDVEAIISNSTTRENQKLMQQHYRKVLDKRNFDVFFSFDRPDGGKVGFGVRVRIETPIKAKKKNSLALLSPDTTCTPIIMKRMDKDILVPRGGAKTNLQEKKVLIIGCGSLGGYIASEIAKVGIMHITLVDPDNLNPENVYRHIAGFPYIHMKKVDAVKSIIERFMIHPQIHASSKSVKEFFEESIEKLTLNLGIYDLIVVATGDPNVDRYINKYIRTSPKSPPTIFTWVEPYDIGGQALLTNNNEKNGCLECLYFGSQNDCLYNKASFAEKGQSFTQTVSGCSGLFTPFGSLSSMQTAVLAVQLSMDVLNGREEDNPIRSWKGEGASFQEAGKITSNRYDLTMEQIEKSRYKYKEKDCTVCRKETNE